MCQTIDCSNIFQIYTPPCVFRRWVLMAESFKYIPSSKQGVYFYRKYVFKQTFKNALLGFYIKTIQFILKKTL